MKKVFLGIILGVGGTILLQRMYKTNVKFRYVVESAKDNLGLKDAPSNLNIFDKASLIYQKLRTYKLFRK